MVDYEALGRRMKMKRRSKHLSQETVAKAVSISTSYYGNIERGMRIPSVDTLVEIANVLNVGTDYLLYDSVKAANPRLSQAEMKLLSRYLRARVVELDYGDLEEEDDDFPEDDADD
ncbi:MAG: helix-turn-helix transcriptional regulator [Clostridia bacterium]|nr:helix-turn-helix transcriptional regulator [Clostridia bacterium]